MALKDRYMTISEAAQTLETTRQTVSRWIVKGDIPIEKVGREILIDRNDLISLYDEKMYEMFYKVMQVWIRMVIYDYLQENKYIAENSGMMIESQSREYIKVQGIDGGGIYKVFTIPIGQIELVMDTKAKRLFYIKKAKVVVRNWRKPRERNK